MPENSPLYRPKDVEKLKFLHPDLVRVVNRAARNGARFIIICTHRNKADQEKAFKGGFSKAKFGESPHNYDPALAFDFGPYNYPGTIDDHNRLAIAFKEAAKLENVLINWGGDFKSFKDRPHIELANWKQYIRKLTA